VDISIESHGTNMDDHNVSVYQGYGLKHPISCTTTENTANYNNLSITWQHNESDVQFSSGYGLQPGIYQVSDNGTQRLYISDTVMSDQGLYSCLVSLTIGNTTVQVVSRSFTLNFNGTLFHIIAEYVLTDVSVYS
jgi:hypothetical protein